MWHYFYSYFDRKQTKKAIAFFVQKHGLTPLEKYDFSDFEKYFLYSQKKVCFLSKTSLHLTCSPFFDEKQIKLKLAFFDQKHGLTSLEKCDFNDFETIRFYSQNKFLFYLQMQ